MTRPALACLLALGLAGPLAASEWQTLDSLEQAAEAGLRARVPAVAPGERLEIAVGRIDRRLRLAACAEPVQTTLPAGARLRGRTTLLLSCPQPSWKIHVSATISHYAPVLVARVTLARDLPISASQIELQERDLGRLSHAALRDAEAVIGRLPSRQIQAGQVLNPRLIEAPSLVRRGERVTISAGDQRFQIRMRGEALGDAARGERVRVKALGSQRVIEATVVAAGEVRTL